MAARFWVGGTGTWDAADTTHWSATSGGGGSASVPGTSDAVTFDASSGGGTVTVNTTVAVQSITFGAMVGTLDFATNDAYAKKVGGRLHSIDDEPVGAGQFSGHHFDPVLQSFQPPEAGDCA